jgi:hypothetical protein
MIKLVDNDLPFQYYVKGTLLIVYSFVDEKKHASTIFGNKCCFSGGRMCNNISII